jgi:uncharacterized protein DUF5989
MGGTDFKTNWSTATELLAFVWRGKRWWLTPIVVVLLLMSAMVVLLESSAVAPFIYALF